MSRLFSPFAALFRRLAAAFHSLVPAARIIVLLIGFLLLLTVALDVAWQLSQPGGWYLPLAWVPLSALRDSEYYLIFAGLCLVIPFLYFYLSLVEKRLERGIVGKGSDGDDISLTPEAVERVVVREVRRDVEEVLAVRRCTVTQGRRGAHVFLVIAVLETVSVPAARRKAVDSIKNTLERIIGFADASEIQVKVADVARSDKSRPRRPANRKQPRRRAEAREEVIIND